MTPFFFNLDTKAAFLANMAGRLKDTINEDCAVLLKERGISTPISDVSLLLFIGNNPDSSIADAARALDYSHQRTSARVMMLEKLQLIEKHKLPGDSRCSGFTLTPLGRQDLNKLQEVYTLASDALTQLMKDIDCDLMAKLLEASESLKRFPLSQRINTQ